MNSVLPSISPQVSALAPGFRARALVSFPPLYAPPWSGPMRSAPPAGGSRRRAAVGGGSPAGME